MDQIKIVDLEVFCNHGVFPEENKLGQKFLVSADLLTDVRAAGIQDNLERSIHYGEVSQYIYKFMRENTYKLIEAAAEHLAHSLLQTLNGLKKVKIEIKKPWAPIGLSLEYASVVIERGWHTAYLALGSNLGDKRAYLESAVESIHKHLDCKVVSISEFFSTAPYGDVEQDDFLNGCMKIETLLEPEELLQEIHMIEQAAGRERKVHWGPRTLDIDILFYDDLIMENQNLIIPHVDMQNRDFVLLPLSQIAPHKLHPVFHKTVLQLKNELKK